MTADDRLISDRFPRASCYHAEWILAGVSGGANPLWLTEWLTESLDLRPGMRVLDLGCGRALSSVFLHREFGVQVWATDLWFSASENIQRVRDAGAENGVFPIRADARSMPFSEEFFDAIVSIDSFMYRRRTDAQLFDPFMSVPAEYTKQPLLRSQEWGPTKCVATAIYHATGKRIRDLPITLDKLL